MITFFIFYFNVFIFMFFLSCFLSGFLFIFWSITSDLMSSRLSPVAGIWSRPAISNRIRRTPCTYSSPFVETIFRSSVRVDGLLSTNQSKPYFRSLFIRSGHSIPDLMVSPYMVAMFRNVADCAFLLTSPSMVVVLLFLACRLFCFGVCIPGPLFFLRGFFFSAASFHSSRIVLYSSCLY